MNEKLKELAGSANFGDIENNEVVFDKRLDVFSQLIVEEVIRFLHEDYECNIENVSTEHFADNLKTHFHIK